VNQSKYEIFVSECRQVQEQLTRLMYELPPRKDGLMSNPWLNFNIATTALMLGCDELRKEQEAEHRSS
jgi:hypothetical protein